jgi:transcriptional regulator
LGKDQLQGALDLLILKMLGRGPLHGYGLAQHIQQDSEEALRVEEGSLYPALHCMEQLEWISAESKATENGRRAKYYKLTLHGRKRLARKGKDWSRVVGAVSKILRYA